MEVEILPNKGKYPQCFKSVKNSAHFVTDYESHLSSVRLFSLSDQCFLAKNYLTFAFATKQNIFNIQPSFFYVIHSSKSERDDLTTLTAGLYY